MTLAQSPSAGSSGNRGRKSHDPVLDKLARTNTFDSDWPTLRDHLRLALSASLEAFLTLGPRQSSACGGSTSAAGPSTSPALSASTNDDKPPPESLLLSPSSAGKPHGAADSGKGSPRRAGPSNGDQQSSTSQSIDVPTTPGGLIIPPFPPLDRSKKRRDSAPLLSAKMNGHSRQQGLAPEEEWDEDLIIGGKKLEGWMDEEEAKKELERVGQILEALQCAPFTIQRIAELLDDPTRMHSSIGKFLRALEKALLVSTPWEPPSYTYVPPSETTSGGLYGPSGSVASSASSDAGSDEESLVPPRATTPMFSPIPFLRFHDDETTMLMHVDAPGETSGSAVEDGLMSPLALDYGAQHPDLDTDAAGSRSHTPEPADLSKSPTKATATDSLPPTKTAEIPIGLGPNDPGHQSYLGRVDELDTGPITHANGAGGADDVIMTSGTGEGGNMMPHGMSEKPVPISSTTVLGDEERKIAGLPKSNRQDPEVEAEEQEEVEEKPENV